MSRKSVFIVIAVLIAIPSVLYGQNMQGAYGLPGMGGTGGFVDEVRINTRDVGEVIYAHSKHGTECGMCHPKVFKKKNNSNHATMKQMERGRSCGACHNGKKAFSVKGSCVKCHNKARDIVFKVEDPGNVTFPHEAHLANYGCGECHPDLFKAKRGANRATMEDMENGQSCGACHDGSGAFGVADEDGCESCHQS